VRAPHPRAALAEHLRRLGLRPGAIAMVHASVRAIGPVFGGPDEIHRAVEDAVAPGGTVMMYVGCQDGFDEVGRNVYTPEQEADILAHQPAFDPHAARASRDFGILAEFFRSTPGTLCSGAVDGRVAARGARRAGRVAGRRPCDRLRRGPRHAVRRARAGGRPSGAARRQPRRR